MINPTFDINKAFKEPVTKCMKTKFRTITQPHISKTLAKNNIRELALLMFNESRNILSMFSKR